MCGQTVQKSHQQTFFRWVLQRDWGKSYVMHFRVFILQNLLIVVSFSFCRYEIAVYSFNTSSLLHDEQIFGKPRYSFVIFAL